MTYEELIKELFWEVRNAEIDPEDPTIKALIQTAYDYGEESAYAKGYKDAKDLAIEALEEL